MATDLVTALLPLVGAVTAVVLAASGRPATAGITVLLTVAAVAALDLRRGTR